MVVSYKKLWKILIDKEMKKKDLKEAAGISSASMTKLCKGQTVSMGVLIKICRVLKCGFGEIIDLIEDDKVPSYDKPMYTQEPLTQVAEEGKEYETD